MSWPIPAESRSILLPSSVILCPTAPRRKGKVFLFFFCFFGGWGQNGHEVGQFAMYVLDRSSKVGFSRFPVSQRVPKEEIKMHPAFVLCVVTRDLRLM